MCHGGKWTKISERSRLYVASGAIRLAAFLLSLARRLYRARLLIFSDLNSRDADNITPRTIAATACAFLSACASAQSALPKLRTGVPEHDQKDAELIARIKSAIRSAGS
jgi:hypothetical protein